MTEALALEVAADQSSSCDCAGSDRRPEGTSDSESAAVDGRPLSDAGAAKSRSPRLSWRLRSDFITGERSASTRPSREVVTLLLLRLCGRRSRCPFPRGPP